MSETAPMYVVGKIERLLGPRIVLQEQAAEEVERLRTFLQEYGLLDEYEQWRKEGNG